MSAKFERKIQITNSLKIAIVFNAALIQVLKTIPWNLVDIKVLGIETQHAGKVFNGTEDDIVRFLQSMEYKKTKKVEHDTFFMKNT